MNVKGFTPVDALGTWTAFCSLSFSRFWTVIEMKQVRLARHSYHAVLQQWGVNHRTYICYSSRDYLIAGHKPEDADLIICWKHTWEGCPLQVIEVSDPFYLHTDEYLKQLETTNQDFCMRIERLEAKLEKLQSHSLTI